MYWQLIFFFSSRRRHTRCALVTGVQTCALPISIDEFVRNLVDFFPLHTRGAILSLSRAEDGMLVNYELAADVHTSHRHVVELGFSVLLAEIRRHCVGWFPRSD